MTGKRLDAEQVLRDWLARSAPDRAPASLKEALEEATSRPAGHARPWPRAGGHGLRWAGRVAAAAAILAIAISGAYLYGNGRATTPGASSSASTSAAGSPTRTPEATPSTASLKPRPTVVQLPGSNWRLVSGAFPQIVVPAWAPYQSTVFELIMGSSVGFVAFVPSAGGVASHRPSDAILAAFKTAGPTAPASWETRVYQSTDGVNWTERAALPGNAATVTAVAESGGNIVAVGWTGETPNETAMAWTTTDLQTWHAADLPAPSQSDTYSDAFSVAAGPAGFLAWGFAGASTEFWISADGVAWNSVATSGLPAEPPIDALYGLSDGWAIRGFLSDRAAVWQTKDGAHWTRTWTGPGPSGIEFYTLGPIFKAPGGGYLSFGGVGAGGGPAAVPLDMLIWTSPDLLHWTITDRITRPGWMYDFATIAGRYVAAGQAVVGDGGQNAYGSLGVWTSQDGRSWQAAAGLPAVGSVQVLSVVGDGAYVVVVCVDQQGNVQLLVGDGLS
jgi:hypothetical protein